MGFNTGFLFSSPQKIEVCPEMHVEIPQLTILYGEPKPQPSRFGVFVHAILAKLQSPVLFSLLVWADNFTKCLQQF